jgi:eukaryotic-like serine/threonine-protein kinase
MRIVPFIVRPKCNNIFMRRFLIFSFVVGLLYGNVIAQPTADPKSSIAVKWKFRTQGRIFSSPALSDNLLLIGSADKNLYALNQESGKLIWKVETAGAIQSTPVVSNTSAYFLSYDGFFRAVEFSTGKVLWKFQTLGEKTMGDTSYWGMKPRGIYFNDLWDCFLSSACVDEEKSLIYFGSSDNHLYALNLTDGSLKWKFKAGGSIHSSPTLANGTIYVGSWDGKLYAVDSQTGHLKWSFQTGTQTGMTGIQASPVVHDGVVLFGARDANFYTLDAAKGKQLWKYSAGNAWIVGSAVVKGDMVYVGTSDTYLLLGLDLKTGTEKFRFKTNGYIFGTPVVKDGNAFVGDFTGKMFAINLTTKEHSFFSTDSRRQFSATVLKDDTLDFGFAANGGDFALYETSKAAMDKFYTLGPITSSPAIKNNVLYFGSTDGFVYALTFQKKGEQ